MAQTLSVIIPVHNARATLDRCVASIVAQTYHDWRAILVDDGSTDGSSAVCDQWAEREPRITAIHKENAGPSSARNAGLRQADGEYVTFVDADDYIENTTYENVMQHIGRSDTDIVEYGWTRCRQPYTLKTQAYRSAREYWEDSKAWTHCYVWNKIFRRTAIGRTRFRNIDIAEDMMFMADILATAPRVSTLSLAGYHYEDTDGSLSHDTSVPAISTLLKAELHAAWKMRTTPLSPGGRNLWYYICCRMYDIVRFTLKQFTVNSVSLFKSFRSFTV